MQQEAAFVEWMWRSLELAAVGVVSSLFTTLLARRRFVSERWWERKADAYTRILDALVQIHRYHEANYDDLTHEATLSEDRRAELTAAWRAAWQEVDHAIRLGAFVISQQAHAALTKWQTTSRDSDEDDLFSLVDAAFAATKVCIGEIREVGRRDLELGSDRPAWSRLVSFGKGVRRGKPGEPSTS